jgi:tetratricopeptide (TPR) repeat protein
MAHTARLRRKDLKRPDEFLTLTGHALTWARANQRTVTIIGGTALALLVGISAAISLHRTKDRDANADLGRAMIAYRDAKGAGGANQLNDVARRWSSTPAGAFAKLLAASVELRRDNADSALVSLRELGDDRSLPSYLTQQAVLGDGYALEAKNQCDQAIAKYAAAAAIDGPYIAQALLSQARCLQTTGQADKAHELYERIRKDFPEVAARELIEGKLPANP